MPTYEYRCAKGHAFEVFQRMSDEPVSTCPECGAEAERLLSAGAGLLFKGPGFYVTDYRKDEGRPKSEGEAAKEPPSSSSSTPDGSGSSASGDATDAKASGSNED